MYKRIKTSSQSLASTNFSWLDLFKSSWYFLEEDKSKFVFYFILLSLIFVYDLVPAYIIGKIVDFFTTYRAGQPLSTFYYYVGFISLSWIIASLIRLESKIQLGVLGQNARARARTWGFERLTEFSLEWHNKENTGNKLQRIFSGAEGMVGWMKLLRRDLVRIFANSFGITLFFLSVDFKFFLLVAIFIFLFLYIEFTFGKKVFVLSNEFNQLNQKAGGTYIESANNMLSIKALGSEEGVLGRVTDKEELARVISIKKMRTSNLKWK